MSSSYKDPSNVKKHSETPIYAKFAISGLAGCGSTVVVQPIDVLKSRMQLNAEGGGERVHKTTFHAIRNIFKNEGIASFYKGFSANIARQLSYTSIRLGTFQTLNDHFKKHNMEGLAVQIYSSLIGGFLGSLVATPNDVIIL